MWPDPITQSKILLYIDKQQQVVTMGIADAVGNREIGKRLKCAKELMKGSENQRNEGGAIRVRKIASQK